MSPSLLKLILHIGGILKTLRDVEALIVHLAKHQGNLSDDGKRVVADLGELLKAGIITVPGLTPEQLGTLVDELIAGLSSKPAPAAIPAP